MGKSTRAVTYGGVSHLSRLFPNEASLLRLVSAVLSETSEDWETGKIYLTMQTNATGDRNTEKG